MKQVCLVEGGIRVLDTPAPVCSPRGVLVRTEYSLISTGTELAGAGTGGGPVALLRHALANPRLVRKVWDRVATTGVRQTAELIRSRQDASLPVGYSSAGTILEVGAEVAGLQVGDRVACAGAGYATHAEYNAVPTNLAAPVQPGVNTRDAAFATLGAIALHGVRRGEPTLGERFVVIGLGLLGQLASQLLRAGGARVFGVDVRPDRVAAALALGMEDGCTPEERPLDDVIGAWTGGAGADGAIVCASSGDSALLNRSFDLCRRKGRVVLIGDVPIRIARDRIYRKEIDFRISTSYGPGRYDPDYEERGRDYPFAYVRWTEGRNLQEVLRLIASGQLNVGGLVGDVLPVDSAPAAYERLRQPDSPLAILLSYSPDGEAKAPARSVRLSLTAAPRSGQVVLGVIGAGAFFRGQHLGHLKRDSGVFIKAIASRSGLTARDVAAREGIPVAAAGAEDVLADPEIQAVFIATRHDLHATLVERAAAAGKHVFVEKPLGITVEECERARSAAARAGVLVAVGFNRRFSPLSVKVRQAAAAIREPRMLVYRVNAGALPPEHWLLDPREGGGRLIGEGVHFFDWMRWLIGADVVRVSAKPCGDANNAVVTLAFADGSTGTLIYAARGGPGLPKERIEVFGGTTSIVLDDFRSVEIYTSRDRSVDRRRTIEKGHAEILANFFAAVRGESPLGVTADDGYWATWCAAEALTAMARGRP